MKQVIVIRHAKSSWTDASQSDFDRPLNERGKHDAPAMAQRLLQKQFIMDAFITSAANRAQTTAGIFAAAINPQAAFIITENLYLAPSETFYQLIKGIDNAFNTVAIFAHNPGITDFVNTLTTYKTDNVPTCGMFAVSSKANTWSVFAESEKQFLFYDYPKLGD